MILIFFKNYSNYIAPDWIKQSGTNWLFIKWRQGGRATKWIDETKNLFPSAQSDRWKKILKFDWFNFKVHFNNFFVNAIKMKMKK